ncbi:hypothetical protein JTE90_017420 [Oedothorax gibbosus]|uniref:tRNA-uridine aminocarboxypropyltransferase 1 n=1 Tax=Oedothorax gibbosus TaxID=931172 RepID=A0AAV6U7R7_9ARAC|nr:hypothetical protein JTE90_017420 [Oedothorax gibbosus]
MDPAAAKKRFIETSSFFTNCETADPFADMMIDDCSFLDEIPSRSPCPKCHKSRKYYCYTCYVAVEQVAKRLPTVDLPVCVDIIRHAHEVEGKSTCAHAALLAPRHVTVHTYPHVPDYTHEKVLLIFPGPSAVSLEECLRMDGEEPENGESRTSNEAQDIPKFPFTKVVFIDSTWRQTKLLYNDPRLKRLPCVSLSGSYPSLYWRYSRLKGPSHLSTVEALHRFCGELHSALRLPRDDRSQYDNLLFFFRFMYFRIRAQYGPHNIRAYAGHEG